ncbi:unnamed protein product [Peniophora sp. CBMAI 1063]|nr:unnamed protein product [Peniophora sp. CBMAI 1063]
MVSSASQPAHLEEELDRARQTIQQQTTYMGHLQDEVYAARAFLEIRDTSTEKAIIDIVETINYDILQVASLLFDEVSPSLAARSSFHDDCALCATFKSNFGSFRFLGNPDPALNDAKDTLRLSIIQAAFVSVCHDYMQPWHVTSQGKAAGVAIEAFMKDLSASMLDEEEQAISGNWRALTHRHASRLMAPLGPAGQDAMLKDLHSFLLPVWHVFGLSAEAISASQDAARDACMFLIKEVLRFKREAAQRVVSSELQPFMPLRGTLADERVMQLYFTTPAAAARVNELVECCVGLGLRRTTRTSRGVEVTNLLRAQVVPSSFILFPLAD